MSLMGDIKASKSLSYSIAAIKKRLQLLLELERPPIVTLSEKTREEIINRAQRQAVAEGKAQNDKLQFAYSFIVINGLTSERDQQNAKAMARVGEPLRANGTLARTGVAKTFPITLGIEFHYIDDDAKRLLEISQAICVLAALGNLQLHIQYAQNLAFAVRLEIPTDVQVGLQEEQSSQFPEATELTVSFIVHTQVVIIQDKAAVISPTPDVRVTVQDDHGNSMEEFMLGEDS